MTWNSLKSHELDFAEKVSKWLYTFSDIYSIPEWHLLTRQEQLLGEQVALWISTAQKFRYGSNWLPTRIDAYKSALLERIYNGRDPLDYPPPIGLACPWYSLVEDAGPHRVGQYGHEWHVRFYTEGDYILESGQVLIVQNVYRIISQDNETSYVICDDHYKESPYRFRLKVEDGYWIVQNIEFEKNK